MFTPKAIMRIDVVDDLPPIKWVNGADSEPYEYFCKDCHQLRLSFVVSDKCTNCGSLNIVKGKVGSLDKNRLIYEGAQNVD